MQAYDFCICSQVTHSHELKFINTSCEAARDIKTRVLT